MLYFAVKTVAKYCGSILARMAARQSIQFYYIILIRFKPSTTPRVHHPFQKRYFHIT